MRRKIAAFFIVGLLILVSVLMLRPPSIAAGSSTLTIRPNAAGTFTGWTASVGSNWQSVDEEIPNDDTDYVYWTPSPSRRDSYNLQDHTTENGTISNVRVVIYAKLSAAGDDQITMGVVIAGEPYDGVTVTPTTTYAQYTSDWPTNPQTGSAWTWSDIDALETGFVCEKVGPTSPEHRVTQLYVEVTYTPLVVHDVAILSVTPSANTVHVGKTVNVTVVAKNEGTETETFNVTAYYDSTAIETKTVSNLAAGANTTLTFGWNTTGIPLGTYTIKAEASVVPGETDTADNTLTDGTVTVVKAPVASFTYSPITPRIGEIVTFNASDSTPDGGTIVSYAWDFGDGFFGTGMITNHTYADPGTYVVTLNVTDSEGLSDTESKSITVVKAPVASFTYSPLSPLIGETVSFNASQSTPDGGTIVNYAWDFGDLTMGSGVVVTHVYSTEGNYTVILNVTDSEGLSDMTSKSITVRKPPVAAFTFSPSSPLVNETVTFNASLSTPNGGTIVSYDWDFGDGFFGTGMIVNHTYATFGTYTVKLTITDSEGLTDSTTDTVKVYSSPVAIFTYSPSYPLVGETVTFNASASYDPDGIIISWDWTFGDGTVGSGEIVTHVYTAVGDYIVTLTVTDNNTITDTATETVTVTKPPVAVFTYSPLAPLVGETVTFNASGSTPNGGAIISYDWDFGDLTTGSGVVVTHVYLAVGNYTVTLVVTDSEGLSDTESKSVVVGLRDVAVISVTPSATEVLVGETVAIDVVVENQGTVSEDFTVTAFYDSNIIGTQPVTLGAGANTTVSFLWNTTGVALGSYTIKANATVVAGETDTADNEKIDGTVTIKKKPVASFTYEPVAPAVGQDVTFNASSSTPDGGVLTDPGSYAWDFETDGVIDAYGMVVIHTFAVEGTYNVTLTVTDSEGLSDSTWELVEVYLHDVAVISVTPSATKVIVGETVTIDVVVENQGTASESFTVTAFYDSNIIGTQPVALGPGAYTTVLFTWDTAGVLPGFNYTIKAEASVVTGEKLEDQVDNTYVDGDVWVTDYPVATFTISPDPAVVDVFPSDILTFNASVSTPNGGAITSWDWDWGDGTAHGTLEIDTHIYAASGTYTVNLTVTDSEGLSDSTTKSVTIKGNPVARFTISPDPTVVDVYALDVLTFNASGSTPDGGTIIGWDWDFGDLSTGIGEVVTHAYASPGTYTVTLTVTDSDNLSNSTSKTFTIKGVHDVAVVDVTPLVTEAYPTWLNGSLSISVTVANEGDFTENFTVTAYYYNVTAAEWVAIDTLTVTDLASLDSTTLIFNWTISGITPPLNATIKAEADLAPTIDDDPTDNTFTDGFVYIKVPGDVNGDGTVNVSDLGLLGLAWGSSVGDPNYDPRCDFNGDGVINVSDLGIMGLWWGYTAG